MAKYRVVAPARGVLVPGAIIDSAQIENIESLVRLGIVVPYNTKPKQPSKKVVSKT